MAALKLVTFDAENENTQFVVEASSEAEAIDKAIGSRNLLDLDGSDNSDEKIGNAINYQVDDVTFSTVRHLVERASETDDYIDQVGYALVFLS